MCQASYLIFTGVAVDSCVAPEDPVHLVQSKNRKDAKCMLTESLISNQFNFMPVIV